MIELDFHKEKISTPSKNDHVQTDFIDNCYNLYNVYVFIVILAMHTPGELTRLAVITIDKPVDYHCHNTNKKPGCSKNYA